MRFLKSRRFWSAVVLLLLIVGIVALIAVWASSDEPPPADEDLRSYRRSVPDGSNGFHAVDITTDSVFSPDDDTNISGTSDNFDVEAAREVIERNAEVFRKLDESLAAPDFQGPELQGTEDPLPYLLAWRRLAYAASCRQLFLFETGKEKESFEQGMKLVRFGHRIEGSQGGLIQYLVGLAIKRIAIDAMIRLLNRTNLGPAELKPLIEEVGRYPAHPEGLQDAYRAAYTVCAGFIDGLVAADPGLLEDMGINPWSRYFFRGPYFRPQQTKRLFAEDVRTLIQSASLLPGSREGLNTEEKYWVRFPGALFTNGAGKAILRTFLPSMEWATRDRDGVALSVRALQTLLALKCFQSDRGRLPGSLDELVPAYLKEVPLDPFDGKPLRYSAKKRIVYSVGGDLKDSGGSREEDVSEARSDWGEPTFRIEF